SGGQERVARHGAEGVAGSDQGIRPARVRAVAQGLPAYAVPRGEAAGRGVPDLGSAGGSAKDQVRLFRRQERDGTTRRVEPSPSTTVNAAFRGQGVADSARCSS